MDIASFYFIRLFIKYLLGGQVNGTHNYIKTTFHQRDCPIFSCSFVFTRKHRITATYPRTLHTHPYSSTYSFIPPPPPSFIHSYLSFHLLSIHILFYESVSINPSLCLLIHHQRLSIHLKSNPFIHLSTYPSSVGLMSNQLFSVLPNHSFIHKHPHSPIIHSSINIRFHLSSIDPLNQTSKRLLCGGHRETSVIAGDPPEAIFFYLSLNCETWPHFPVDFMPFRNEMIDTYDQFHSYLFCSSPWSLTIIIPHSCWRALVLLMNLAGETQVRGCTSVILSANSLSFAYRFPKPKCWASCALTRVKITTKDVYMHECLLKWFQVSHCWIRDTLGVTRH